ncbi:MAG: ATP-binding protein, partial [Candidatus Limnocylindrales bacterium]
ALTPLAPLRRWRLVALADGGLVDASLRLDERILHFLAGLDELDERLAPILRPLPAGADRAGDRHEAIHRMFDAGIRTVQVTGRDDQARTAAIAEAAAAHGATPVLLREDDLPAHPDDRHAITMLIAREWHLARRLVVLESDAAGADGRTSTFVAAVEAPLLVSAREPLPALAERVPVVEVAAPDLAQRVAAWRAVLGADAESLDGALTEASLQFGLSPTIVRDAARDLAVLDGDTLWEACRLAARPRMDGLAQRIEAASAWDDIVLPEPQLRTLRTIATQVHHRHRVYEDWGFARTGARGLGITALFVGDPGTGKTMAAEVLARELRLDLYRIDLATVVSKYIGETEKNLQRLFDAAEGSGAILLFDEADALFGRRSEVRDSHDRYANVEVSYLLQRMETYRGLAILTTNMQGALDPAFLRRIRFVVRFPFPDADHRAAIWRRIFPAETPREPLDESALAQLDLAGGHIRNIALGAAFVAAGRAEPVGMAHIAEAARAEYAKLERPLTDAEMRGWA